MKFSVLGSGVEMTGTQAAVTAAVVVVGVWLLFRQAKKTVKDVAEAVNPVNQNNVINSGFNSVYSAIFHQDGSAGTLGTDIAEWLHGNGSM